VVSCSKLRMNRGEKKLQAGREKEKGEQEQMVLVRIKEGNLMGSHEMRKSQKGNGVCSGVGAVESNPHNHNCGGKEIQRDQNLHKRGAKKRLREKGEGNCRCLSKISFNSQEKCE